MSSSHRLSEAVLVDIPIFSGLEGVLGHGLLGLLHFFTLLGSLGLIKFILERGQLGLKQ